MQSLITKISFNKLSLYTSLLFIFLYYFYPIHLKFHAFTSSSISTLLKTPILFPFLDTPIGFEFILLNFIIL